MEKEIKRANKIYPWYSGLSNDLIFYIAINAIWLTTIKGFNPSQISLLTSISSLFAIIFQLPLLWLMKKIGNRISIITGSLCLLIASVMLTFCSKYIFFAIAYIFIEMSLVFDTMSAVLIKNNLEYLKQADKYVKIRSKASVIYAVATAMIAVLIGPLFSIHKFLPMILGIGVCVLCFVLSIFLVDAEKNENIEKVKYKRTFPRPILLLICFLLIYGIVCGIIVIAQGNGKLLIQYQLLNYFTIEQVATYLGIVLFVSRLVRIITSYFYPQIYEKLKDKTVYLLIIILLLALSLILLGFYIKLNILIKLLIMTIGFSLIPGLRDPIKIYFQNFTLQKYESKFHKDILVYLTLFRHVGKLLLSLLASYILLKLPLQYLFIIFIIMCIPLLLLTFNISRLKEKSIKGESIFNDK